MITYQMVVFSPVFTLSSNWEHTRTTAENQKHVKVRIGWW